MKKTFITGLVILLPLAVTLAVVIFIFNLLTDPFAGFVSHILDRYDLLETDFFFATGREIQFFFSKVLILIFLFFFTVLLGAIARYFFFRYLMRLWDYMIHKIPLVRSIYKVSQDVIHTIFTADTKSFKQVVMVPFPHENTFSVGLVTQDQMQSFMDDESDRVAVFVPTTPNPTSGFLMVFDRKDVIYLDMKVEEAFKYIISCGVIDVNFNEIPYTIAKNLMQNNDARNIGKPKT